MSKLAVLFPGQGAQTVGMGRSLFQSHAAVRRLFEQANQVLGYDLAKICFEGPAEKLNSTVHSQPALFVTSMAGIAVLRESGEEQLEQAVAAAGLSLGEYTALAFADAIDFDSGLQLVQRRGEAMQAAADLRPGAMVSVLGLDREVVGQLCEQSRQPGEVLEMANLLCPGNIAVSGDRQACDRLQMAAEAAGAVRCAPLAVAGAFHTRLMQPAADQLADALRSVNIRPPQVPVVSNVDAVPHDDPEEIRQLLLQQLCRPVRWEDSMRRLLEMGCDRFLEVGTGRVLRGLMKRIDRRADFDGFEV